MKACPRREQARNSPSGSRHSLGSPRLPKAMAASKPDARSLRERCGPTPTRPDWPPAANNSAAWAHPRRTAAPSSCCGPWRFPGKAPTSRHGPPGLAAKTPGASQASAWCTWVPEGGSAYSSRDRQAVPASSGGHPARAHCDRSALPDRLRRVAALRPPGAPGRNRGAPHYAQDWEWSPRTTAERATTATRLQQGTPEPGHRVTPTISGREPFRRRRADWRLTDGSVPRARLPHGRRAEVSLRRLA